MNDAVLPERHVWLRLTQPHDDDPFDASLAQARGGPWNPPDSWPTLYFNETMASVHAQLRRLFAGRGIDPDDLDDSAPIELAATTLPQRQRVADVVSGDGVTSAGLPATYPHDESGTAVGFGVTQRVSAAVHASGARGVWYRSATGVGNELAWFPGAFVTARPCWPEALPFGAWRHCAELPVEPSR